MIDRKSREQMAQAIRSYMNEEITAFKFDDALSDASEATNDPTVKAVALALWYHYDDVDDHKIVASKEEWNYFNRLLLLLQSDAEMKTIDSGWKWQPLQWAAAILLLAYLVIAVRVGWGEHLFFYAIPFGPLSILLAWLNARRDGADCSAMEIALTPFPSVSCLRKVRRSVGAFARAPFPKAIVKRRIRSRVLEYAMRVRLWSSWCLVSPVVLFFQMLPYRVSENRIELGDAPNGEMLGVELQGRR